MDARPAERPDHRRGHGLLDGSGPERTPGARHDVGRGIGRQCAPERNPYAAIVVVHRVCGGDPAVDTQVLPQRQGAVQVAALHARMVDWLVLRPDRELLDALSRHAADLADDGGTGRQSHGSRRTVAGRVVDPVDTAGPRGAANAVRKSHRSRNSRRDVRDQYLEPLARFADAAVEHRIHRHGDETHQAAAQGLRFAPNGEQSAPELIRAHCARVAVRCA